MPDRLAEIRARLDAATLELATSLMFGRAQNTAALAFIEAAPADIAWLLDEVERLERENADDLLEITRKASDAEDYWMQEAKRLAAEVERLRNTKASLPNPLCDASVVQDVTKQERP